MQALLDLDALDAADIAAFHARQEWLRQARSAQRKGKQIPPDDLRWEILLWRAGRGFGKTKALTEFGWWESWRVPNLICHVVAPTQADVRGTSFEGPAGFNAVVPAECLVHGTLEKAYNKSTHELRLNNGSLIRGFAATENGSRLRGPQCNVLLGDEVAAWDVPAGNLEQSLNNALFGLRLPYPDGTPARAVLGTTPRPIPYLKRLEKRAGVRVITGTSVREPAQPVALIPQPAARHGRDTDRPAGDRGCVSRRGIVVGDSAPQLDQAMAG